MEVLIGHYLRTTKVLIEGLGRKTARPEAKQSKRFLFGAAEYLTTLLPLYW